MYVKMIIRLKINLRRIIVPAEGFSSNQLLEGLNKIAELNDFVENPVKHTSNQIDATSYWG